MAEGLGPLRFAREAAVVSAGELPGQASESGAESGAGDATLEAINRYTLRPVTREAVAVFGLELCNDQIDKHFSRFPVEELETINRLTPGRPLLERHDLRGTLPRGMFFRSEIKTDGQDAHPTVSVCPDVFVLRTEGNRDFIANIEGGVYRETSIGFSFLLPECSVCGKDIRTCDHIPGRAYKGEQCHFVMRQVVEVIEGSVVAAGSQGTKFVSAERALEAAREEYHTPYELTGRRLAVQLLRERVKARRVGKGDFSRRSK